MSTHRLHVRIEGRVQGVGFRWATQTEAQQRGITGWVRNLPSGQVEAEFYGSRETLDAMLRWCNEGPRFARVDDVSHTWATIDTVPDAFIIR